MIFIPSDWEFDKVVLIKEVNKTIVSTTNDGMLSVLFINRNSMDKIIVTVCADNFNWWTANAFCRYFGHTQGKWGSKTATKSKFVSQ